MLLFVIIYCTSPIDRWNLQLPQPGIPSNGSFAMWLGATSCKTNMTRYDQIWPDMIRYDQIWSDMTRYDQHETWVNIKNGQRFNNFIKHVLLRDRVQTSWPSKLVARPLASQWSTEWENHRSQASKNQRHDRNQRQHHDQDGKRNWMLLQIFKDFQSLKWCQVKRWRSLGLRTPLRLLAMPHPSQNRLRYFSYSALDNFSAEVSFLSGISPTNWNLQSLNQTEFNKI